MNLSEALNYCKMANEMASCEWRMSGVPHTYHSSQHSKAGAFLSPLGGNHHLLVFRDVNRKKTLRIGLKKTVKHGYFTVLRECMTQWQSIKDTIMDTLFRSQQIINVTVTGFGLAGAVAAIAAQHIGVMRPLAFVSCITFGAPAVGDQRFKEEYQKVVKESTRVVRALDPIPMLPAVKGFTHPEMSCIKINKRNPRMETCGAWMKSAFIAMGFPADANHSINKYMACV